MNKEDKKIMKILKKVNSLSDWESLPSEIKQNHLTLKKAETLLNSAPLEKKIQVIKDNPLIISFISEHEQDMYLNKVNFRYASRVVQLKKINENCEYIAFASTDVKNISVKNNPTVLSFLSESEQLQYVNENRFILECASEEVQIKKGNENTKFIAICSKKVQLLFLKKNPNNFKNCSEEVKGLINLKMLDSNLIEVDTLNSYILSKGNSLRLGELINLKEKIVASNRKDKESFNEYVDYLISTYKRNELLKLVIL